MLNYISGQSIDVGLTWTDLEENAVDVSSAEITVTLIGRAMMLPVATFKSTDGTLVVSEDKCKFTISAEQTEDLAGEHLLQIEIVSDGYTRKTFTEPSLYFKKTES